MQLNRDEQLVGLRPEISSIDSVAATNRAEQFQNETLRPILKLQNELFIKLFHHYYSKRKKVFYDLPKAKKTEYIEQALQKDLKFRNYLIGMVVGHFTLSEWEQFRILENEASRRLITMLTKRMQDQIERLSSQPLY